MSNNSELILAFVRQAALFMAESKSLPIEDALSFVYNSDTFRLIDENKICGKDVQQMLEMFKKEIVSGKVQHS